MLTTILLHLLAGTSPVLPNARPNGTPVVADPADTVRAMPMRRGDRLDIVGREGAITVRAGSRSEVRVLSEWRGSLTQDGRVVRLDGTRGRSWADEEDLVVEVPVWLDVTVNTLNGDITLDKVEGALTLSTVHGDITAHGTRGVVSITAVDGEIRVTGARGPLQLNSVNGGVQVQDAEAAVSAETVNDDIVLSGIRSADVAASTVNGDVRFDGLLTSDGRYRFSSHNGDVSIGLPATPDALVTVSTFQGDFESDFPFQASTRKGRRFTISLGRGAGARIDAESFQGTVRLRRAPMTSPR